MPAKMNCGLRSAWSRRPGGTVVQVASTRLPTVLGVFDLIGFECGNVNEGKTERRVNSYSLAKPSIPIHNCASSCKFFL